MLNQSHENTPQKSDLVWRKLALLEAQYFIVCGKLFLAKELLETSSLKDKTDSLLESELQSFYFYAKNKKRA